MKFAGTNWNTTEQVVRIAQKNGLTKKTNKMKKISILKNQQIESFKNEIISGNYKIVSFEKNVCNILVEGCYSSSLWISNMPKIHFCIWTNCFSLPLGELAFNTDEERLKAWNVYKEKEKEYLQTKGKREKQKKINRLRKELEELENTTK